MIDFGIDKLALIGAVALIVIGPERLPRVARTVGVLIGKAQRYVSQVQGEVNRSMELDELKKMKDNLQTAAQDIGQTVQGSLDEAGQALSDSSTADYPSFYNDLPATPYTPPRKNWRLKRGATPLWYKQRNGVRRHVQSGAARVARFRPNRQP
ncbi:MAG: Sec-independent protein translocase subunit TatB [Gammaproteobacteria bacterium]|uniref:Sec-independent protein translocase subunit TatA/TatB n=1 Tax=Aquabacterium sp. UBA2148 TaxID=1946042 RepID=UPI001D4698D8|nr:twin-arginine translocase TatA/TatE family subunit [Aquabacterium sp. UBA2148]MBU0917807.1 Sec-independent protein translocase subunit TatB [Gammaproteobacteria bacterium]